MTRLLCCLFDDWQAESVPSTEPQVGENIQDMQMVNGSYHLAFCNMQMSMHGYTTHTLVWRNDVSVGETISFRPEYVGFILSLADGLIDNSFNMVDLRRQRNRNGSDDSSSPERKLPSAEVGTNLVPTTKKRKAKGGLETTLFFKVTGTVCKVKLHAVYKKVKEIFIMQRKQRKK